MLMLNDDGGSWPGRLDKNLDFARRQPSGAHFAVLLHSSPCHCDCVAQTETGAEAEAATEAEAVSRYWRGRRSVKRMRVL